MSIVPRDAATYKHKKAALSRRPFFDIKSYQVIPYRLQFVCHDLPMPKKCETLNER